MPTYTVHQAKTHLSKLLAEMERGEEVVISRRAKPIARLTAIEPRREPVPPDQPGWRRRPDGSIEFLHTGRRPGTLKGLFELPDSFFDPLPEEELAAWDGADSRPFTRE